MSNYTEIINAINSNNIIDDHTGMVINDIKAVVLLNNGKVGILRNLRSQCINTAYIDEDGQCHLSMKSVSGCIFDVSVDIFKSVSEYNRSYKKMKSRQIIAMYVVI